MAEQCVPEREWWLLIELGELVDSPETGDNLEGDCELDKELKLGELAETAPLSPITSGRVGVMARAVPVPVPVPDDRRDDR